MKRILFLALTISATANIDIFYINNIDNYLSTQVKGKKVGGLPGIAVKIREMSTGDSDSLFLYANKQKSLDKEYEITKGLDILEKAGIKTLILNPDLAFNYDIFLRSQSNIQPIAANLNQKDKLTNTFAPYYNTSLDALKISVIGLVDESKYEKSPIKRVEQHLPNIRLEKRIARFKNVELETSDSLTKLKETIHMLERTFAPSFYIVLSNSNNRSALVEFVKNNDNVILFDANANKIDNLDEIQKTKMVAQEVNGTKELGLFALTITDKKITDFRNSILPINIVTKEESNKIKEDKKKQQQEDKKNFVKIDVKKERDEFENKPVKEDEVLKEFIETYR